MIAGSKRRRVGYIVCEFRIAKVLSERLVEGGEDRAWLAIANRMAIQPHNGGDPATAQGKDLRMRRWVGAGGGGAFL